MYQFKTNSQGLYLLINHEYSEMINSFLQTEGDNFDDIIEVFLLDDQQDMFSGNIFSLNKTKDKLVISNKISYQTVTMSLKQFTKLFKQWLNNK